MTDNKTEQRLARWRASLAEFELEKAEVDSMMDDFHKAREEDSFSGQLRRAIHASPTTLEDLCDSAGISWDLLSEFLAAKSVPSSDDIDRLFPLLKMQIVAKTQLEQVRR